jgi:hypothetical protein
MGLTSLAPPAARFYEISASPLLVHLGIEGLRGFSSITTFSVLKGDMIPQLPVMLEQA